MFAYCEYIDFKNLMVRKYVCSDVIRLVDRSINNIGKINKSLIIVVKIIFFCYNIKTYYVLMFQTFSSV